MSEESRSSKGARGASGAARDPHAARESEKYAAPIASREYILETLRDEGAPIDLEALGERLGLDADADAAEALRRRVRAMIRDGQLIENRRRGLVPVDAESLVAGRISAHPDGFGFLVSEEREKDVFLSAREMRRVLHGDRVVVNITGEDRRGRPEGRIVDVVERANRSLVGRLSIEHGVATVAADSKRIHQDLLVEPGHRQGGEHGDMVVAEITEQPTSRNQPIGRIVEVLGAHLTPGMEIDVALHTHGIPVEWPEAVSEQAASFSTTVGKDSTLGRKDVRDLPLVTIDGADARDFDDAVWCEPLEGDDGWRLLVAIADVAHYVSPGSPLDEEAVNRGTSVYFPGRVVPMLPEVLSNGLCSLNPDVERLCMLCDMTLDARGEVRKARFHNGVLRSHARLTYSQVHEILTEPASPLREERAALVPMLENLHALYKVLAGARRERGAIEFESNETRIVFDGERKISELVPVVRNDAHKLIEECMILANVQAATFLEKAEIPALYRVHNGPKADRLEDLRAFLALHGLSVGGGATPTAADYATLSREIAERPDRVVIQTVMLRSMQQAVYQPKNEGHFGLSLDRYAHFTSPIRRYPDLLVHRAIKHAISREKNAAYRYSQADMQALGESCSVHERRAEEASRDVVSWLKCEYMQQHVGSEFPGVVAAVTSFGLFVDLVDIHVEGLIHITNLSRDYYRFDAAAHALIGERTGQQYHLGDRMVVRVAAVNLDERKIDFAEVSHAAAAGKKRGKPALAVIDGGAKGRQGSTEGSGEGGKGKSRKRRGGKRRRKERAAEAERQAAAANEAATGGAVANGDAVPGDGASASAAAAAGETAPGAKEMSPERRRQLKRREKQRRRDEKRAVKRAEKKAAAAAEGQDEGQAATASAGRDAPAAVGTPAAAESAPSRGRKRRGRKRSAEREAPPAAAAGRSSSWASRAEPSDAGAASGSAAGRKAAKGIAGGGTGGRRRACAPGTLRRTSRGRGFGALLRRGRLLGTGGRADLGRRLRRRGLSRPGRPLRARPLLRARLRRGRSLGTRARRGLRRRGALRPHGLRRAVLVRRGRPARLARLTRLARLARGGRLAQPARLVRSGLRRRCGLLGPARRLALARRRLLRRLFHRLLRGRLRCRRFRRCLAVRVAHRLSLIRDARSGASRACAPRGPGGRTPPRAGCPTLSLHLSAPASGRTPASAIGLRPAPRTPLRAALATSVDDRLGRDGGIDLEPLHDDLGQLAADQPFDVAQQLELVDADQRDGLAGQAGAGGAPDPVHVVLGHVGQLVVDHVGELVDVEAPGGDVGGHQDAYLAALEARQCPRACALALVAVDGRRRQPVLAELLGEAVGTVLGTGEDEHLAPVAGRDQTAQEIALPDLVDRVHDLLDAVGRRVGRGHLDELRVVQQPGGERLDVVGERGREQEVLPFAVGGQQRQHPLDVVDEAHVEHAVGLVEDQVLHRREVHRLLAGVIEQPPGGRDQDVHAAPEPLDLRVDLDAPEDHGRALREVLAVALHALVDLRGELARGGQHQRPHGTGAVLRRVAGRLAREPLQERQREAGGLAGTGLRRGHDVASGQYQRNGLTLDRRGLAVALLVDRAQEVGRQAEVFECHESLARGLMSEVPPSEEAGGVSVRSSDRSPGSRGGGRGRRESGAGRRVACPESARAGSREARVSARGRALCAGRCSGQAAREGATVAPVSRCRRAAARFRYGVSGRVV